jgi:putative flippase GtrA
MAGMAWRLTHMSESERRESEEQMGRLASGWSRVRVVLDPSPRLLRLIRYSGASVAATVVSSGMLAFTFGRLDWGTRPANIAAFCSGALVAFAINRTWAWQHRGSAGIGRHFVRYWLVAVATALIALACTTVADAYARDAGLSHLIQTVIVEGAYFGSYALTFVAKFLLLDRFVFASTTAARSRAQVENTTRA